ncbi:hypothetical protein C1H46_023867 [Malus baccata]|uniref:TELO2 ARM repeat domain-containing protein n=1 Tax=Malus baccata TaxID=106549 RepID=A0A540LVN9_MALBA|nr:hypothetical protein C1H46_023867 [Malus baccata]
MKRSRREEIAAVKKVKHVYQVICALVLLFPLDASLLSGAIDEQYREQVLSSDAPSADERREWWHAFYGGAAFSSSALFPLIDASAAIGLSMENMSKEELNETKDVMHSILKGVSCRLESPNHLIRKMAISIACVLQGDRPQQSSIP